MSLLSAFALARGCAPPRPPSPLNYAQKDYYYYYYYYHDLVNPLESV